MGDETGPVGASREHEDSDSFTAITPAYEDRRIVIAYGLQFHEDEFNSRYTLGNFMPANLGRFPDVEIVSRTEYINHRQRVRFLIEETTDKTAFMNYLETPDVHVIYDGHARYGRGPCFGRNGTADGSVRPGEDWEEGTSASTGIFRMGYPFIGIPVKETLDHGYTANPMKESEGTPARDDCHPDLRARRGRLRARTPERIHRNLLGHLRNHQAGDKYWVYYASDDGEVGPHLVHHAGWENTFSMPFDLGSIDMRCRVFCHWGCDTFHSNYRVVRFLANWRREGNERYAYWTTASSYDGTFTRWVFHLMTYNVDNAFQSWEPSLSYAVQRTNSHLRRDGYRYRVI